MILLIQALIIAIVTLYLLLFGGIAIHEATHYLHLQSHGVNVQTVTIGIGPRIFKIGKVEIRLISLDGDNDHTNDLATYMLLPGKVKRNNIIFANAANIIVAGTYGSIAHLLLCIADSFALRMVAVAVMIAAIIFAGGAVASFTGLNTDGIHFIRAIKEIKEEKAYDSDL